ncbi:alpha/beta fold hydrolase [Nocardia sp. NPDC020380]|uniref:alpha/beta fold hydrolase n=1 Tax=Nocardia sp. NPDC020380 TaxID=3364309 RepID=UPI0037A0C955
MTTATVVSKDGTTIAYEKIGSGPAVVLVDGAFCYREMGPSRPVAEQLSDRFTVYIYDRRARGESGDTLPYDPQREVEDLQAVAAEAGEPVDLVAFSSGCAVTLATVQAGLAVRRIGLYEFPLIVDDSRPPAPEGYQQHIRDLIAAGKNGAAVKYFMHSGIRLPRLLVELFPVFPGWSKLKKTAPTLTYDGRFMGDALDGKPIPAGRYDYVSAPTTVYAGTKSPAWMRNGNAALAQAIPGAKFVDLPGQTHQVNAAKFVPTLKEFLQ